MKNVPAWIRFAIAAGITALYIFALVEWAWFDQLLRSFWLAAFLIAIVLGALCAGITYGVLLNKKTITQSKDAFNEKKYRQAVIGYWTWILIWAVFYCVWMFVRIYDL